MPILYLEWEIFKKKIIKIKFFLFTILLFLFVTFLSLLISIDKYVSFFGYYGRFNGGFLSFLVYSFLAFVILLIFERKDLKTLFKISFATSILVAVIGILSKFNFDILCFVFSGSLKNDCWTVYFKPSERIFSTLGQPNWLATYLGVNFFIGLMFFLKNKKIKIYEILAFIIFSFAIVYTRSTSGICAVFFAFLVGFLLLLRKFSVKNPKFRKTLGLFFIFIFISIISGYGRFIISRTKNATSWIAEKSIKNFFMNQETSQYKNELVEKTKKFSSEEITDSFKIRLIVWKGAIELWKKYPFLGTGIDTFGIAYYFTRPIEHNYTSEWDYLYNKAHNEFLNFLATSGILGLISYLLLLFYPLILSLKTWFKKGDLFYLTGILVFIVIHITNFFGFSTTISNLYLFTFMALIVNQALDLEKIKEKKEIFHKNFFYPIFAFAIVISFLLLFFLIKMYIADLSYAKGKMYENLDNYYQAVQEYNKAIKLFYNPVYAQRLAFTTAFLYSSYTPYKDKLDMDLGKLKDLSTFFINKAIKDSPYNFIYYRTKAKINYLFFQANLEKKYLDIAINNLEKAIKLAPTEPRVRYLYVYFRFIESRDSKNELEKLLIKEIENLISLKTDYAQAHILKAKILFALYGEKSAKEYLIEKAKELNNPDLKVAIKNLNEV